MVDLTSPAQENMDQRTMEKSAPDTDIRLAQDLLFFAYRDFTNAADVILEELGLGRAHHRAMHFIGRHPGITVSELLSILRITKQSLGRVINDLMDRGYVAQTPGLGDRRHRLLRLTGAGEALERRLFGRQKARLAEAFLAAGPSALAGFRQIMRGIMDEGARAWVDLGSRDDGDHSGMQG
jgi:DNA-binding MarR family transcriptional regulator